MARCEEISVVYVHTFAVVGVCTRQCDMLCIVSQNNVSALSENSGKQMLVRLLVTVLLPRSLL